MMQKIQEMIGVKGVGAKGVRALALAALPAIAALALACGGGNGAAADAALGGGATDEPAAAARAAAEQAESAEQPARAMPVADRTAPQAEDSAGAASAATAGADAGASSGAGADASAAPGELDPDAVVAAFEYVIGNVHESVLPSVVNVHVVNRVDSPTGMFPGFPQPFPFGQPPTPDDENGGDDGNDAPNNEFFFRDGEGSGFVWDTEGHIVTNQHVIAGAERVVVAFADGTEADAEVLGEDPDSDIAVLKVDMDESELHPVTLGDSNAVKVGQLTVAIGNPFSQEFTTTTGIVSAVGRTIRSSATPFSVPKVIQTDAPINPGNSGGPLLDRRGRVIGINAQIISRTGGNAGIGFAIPVNTAKRVVPSLIDDGSFKYSWLGIRGMSLRPEIAELMGIDAERRGALIIDISGGGPADDAGMRGSDKTHSGEDGDLPYGGDVIIAVDGSPIVDMDDLIVHLLDRTNPGDEVAMTVIRDGEEMDIDVTLRARPDSLE